LQIVYLLSYLLAQILALFNWHILAILGGNTLLSSVKYIIHLISAVYIINDNSILLWFGPV